MYLQGAKDALFQFLHDRAEAQKTAEAYLLLAEYALDVRRSRQSA